MGRRRKRDEEAGCGVLLLLGIAAMWYLWGSHRTIFFIAAAIIIASAIGWAVVRAVEQAEKEKRVRALELADVDRMSGIEFERYVEKLLEHRGYEVERTPASGDLGVDIVAQKNRLRHAVQVKRYNSPVSRRAVSDAVGGIKHYNCNAAMVITNNYFSPGAIELAQSSRCELINRDTLAQWILDFQTPKPATISKEKPGVDEKLIRQAKAEDGAQSSQISEPEVGSSTRSGTSSRFSFTPGECLVLILLGMALIGVFGYLVGLLILR